MNPMMPASGKEQKGALQAVRQPFDGRQENELWYTIAFNFSMNWIF